jgi:hypothetical protein
MWVPVPEAVHIRVKENMCQAGMSGGKILVDVITAEVA